MSRRSVLTAAGAVIAAAAVPPDGAAAAAPKTALKPISMAMHIHGPFSEGTASFSAHLAQAKKYKVDVVWWTDHDFRIAAFQHRQAVHFDGPEEPEKGLAWTWTQERENPLDASTVAFVASPHSPQDGGGKALRLAAEGKGRQWYRGTAWNATANACIADTEVTLDVLPERLDGDGALLVELTLSRHPGMGVLRMQYQIGRFEQLTHAAEGDLGIVRVPAFSARWQRLTFVPRTDAALLWPGIVADDNALTGLRIGVQRAGFVVDRLAFNRARRAGQAGEQLRAEVVAKAAKRFPGVTNYRAMEVSLVRHLNWFGGDQAFPAFTSPPLRDNDPKRTEAMVEHLHSHGGLVCWNHPMDVATREELVKLMIERDCLGVDLVEIGRKPFVDLLWVLDVAARNALFFTAVGSSDDHDAADWAAWEEHDLTYVWAASKARDDLLAALRKGAAWFTDLARFRGSLDLRIGGVSHLGAVLMAKKAVKVDAVATGLPAGAKLEVVTGVVDEAAAVPSAKTTIAKSATVTPGHYVRAQVRLKDGDVVGVSNPLWVLGRPPKRAIPAVRLRKQA